MKKCRLLLACVAGLVAASAAAEETIVLKPDERADWRPSQLFSVLRPDHNFGERFIRVETSPSGAMLDLFYIRSNFQKRYEQAEAPVKVVLPPRVEAGPRDAVTIRAFKEGYRQKQVSVRVDSDLDHVTLELDPLPNTLLATSHVYLAGRGSMSFLTREALTVRVQDRSDGFDVVLAETAKGDGVTEALDGTHSPLIGSVESLQLGEDLLVQVKTTPEARQGYDLRSRQTRDELRDLYVYSVDLVPADGGVAAVKRAREALAALPPSTLGACGEAFDRALRDSLDPAALARALSPRGTFTDPYLRAAMRRLGELSPDGRIHLLDGTTLNGASQLELAAAMSQPADAVGYLAVLRAFVAALEPEGARAESLRGLVAPELPPAEFGKRLAGAEAAERSCSRAPAPRA